MRRDAMHEATLICHPLTPARGVRAVTARVEWLAGGTLLLAYAVDAEPAALRVPRVRASRSAHGLWQHTCFEAFLGTDNAAGYFEFNFSPSSEWAIHRFSSYREGMAHLQKASAPEITVRHEAQRLELEARVPAADLPPVDEGAHRRLGLSAVLEDRAGRSSYWALCHPRERPDFHHAKCFALEL
jgi:hypothetical protein